MVETVDPLLLFLDCLLEKPLTCQGLLEFGPQRRENRVGFERRLGLERLYLGRDRLEIGVILAKSFNELRVLISQLDQLDLEFLDHWGCNRIRQVGDALSLGQRLVCSFHLCL